MSIMKTIFNDFFEQKVQPWQRPRASSRGKNVIFFTSNKMRSYQNDLKSFFRTHFKSPACHEGPLVLRVVFYLERPASVRTRKWPSVKPDADNLTKSVGDSGNKIIWKDDAQIISIHATKRYAKPGERIGMRIIVREI